MDSSIKIKFQCKYLPQIGYAFEWNGKDWILITPPTLSKEDGEVYEVIGRMVFDYTGRDNEIKTRKFYIQLV